MSFFSCQPYKKDIRLPGPELPGTVISRLLHLALTCLKTGTGGMG